MKKFLTVLILFSAVTIYAQTFDKMKSTGEKNVSGEISSSKSNPIIKSVNIKNKYNNELSLNLNGSDPFNPKSEWEMFLPKSDFVSLKIYNLLGKEVDLLINEYYNSGGYKIKYDAVNLTSGIYFFTLRTNDRIITKKFILAD